MQDNNPFFCPFSASQQELVATDCLWFMRSSQIEFSLYVLILHPEPYSQVNGKWQIGKQATCADEITFIPPSTTKLNISPVTGPKNFMDPVPLNRNSKGNTNPRRSRVDCGSSLLEHFHSFQFVSCLKKFRTFLEEEETTMLHVVIVVGRKQGRECYCCYSWR